MTPQGPAIESVAEHHSNGVTTFAVADLGPVASVWKQGAWRVKLTISPDEAIHHSYATSTAARIAAIRHAYGLAR